MSLQMRNNTCLQLCDLVSTGSYGNEGACSLGDQCNGLFGCAPPFGGDGNAVTNEYRMQLTPPAPGSGSDSVPSRIWVQTMHNQHSNKINPGRAYSSNIAIKRRSETVECKYEVLLPCSRLKSNFIGGGNDSLRADMERLAAISIETIGTRNTSILATIAIKTKHSLLQALVLSRTSLPYPPSSAALVRIYGPLSKFICTGATQ